MQMIKNSCKILIIEDDPVQVQIVSSIIEKSKMLDSEINCAGSLEEGMQMLQRVDLDVILLDLILPDSSGYETFDKIHSCCPDIPIVIMSNLDDDEIAMLTVKNGAQDYVPKQILTSSLLSRSIFHAIERKKSEQKLLEERVKYHTLFEASLDATLLLMDGVIVDCNTSTLNMFKLNDKNLLLSHELWEFSPFRDHRKKTLKNNFLNIIKDTKINGSHRFDWKFKQSDGEEFYGDVLMTSIKLDKQPMILTTIRDVSKQKRMETASKESEKYLQTILDTIQTGVLIIDNLTHEIVDANNSVIKMLGLSRQSIIGSICHESICPAGQDEKCEKSCMFEGKTIHESELQKTDGTKITVLKTVSKKYLFGRDYLIVSLSDLSETIKSKKQIQQYVDIVNNMQVGLYVYHLENIDDDRTLRLISLNPAASKITGIPEKVILGKTIDEIFPKLREKGIPHTYAEVVRSGKSVDYEDFYYRDDRIEEAYFSVKAFPLPNNCVGIVFENMTEIARTKKELHNRTEELRNSVTQINCLYDISMIASKDGESLDNILSGIVNIVSGVWKYTDVACTKLKVDNLQYQSSNYRETKWSIFADISIHNKVSGKIEVGYLDDKNLDNKQPFSTQEKRFLKAIAKRVGTIVERKWAEQELYQEKCLMQSLMETIPDHIYFKDKKSEFIRINKAMSKWLNIESMEQAIGKSDFDFFSGEHANKAFQDEQQIMKTGKPLVGIIEKETWPNGIVTWVSTTKLPLKDKSGNIVGTFGVSRNITELKHAEAERISNENLLRKVNRDLEESNKKLIQTQASLIHQEKLASIGQLAAGIAHELNNPLGFISGNFSSLKSYLKNIKEYLAAIEKMISLMKNLEDESMREIVQNTYQLKQKKKIDYILDDLNEIFHDSEMGFERIMSIVQSLRNFSRIDFADEMESYDINSAIDDTLMVAKNEIKYVAKIIKYLSDIPQIECFGNEINQVLLNIIVNAAQAIEMKGEPELGTISIRTYSDENHIYCDISDDGPGIPKEIQKKVFDPFFTTKEIGKGTGLGLNISYDIVVNKHGGSLTLESEVGVGTTFIIKLPIYRNKQNDKFKEKLHANIHDRR